MGNLAGDSPHIPHTSPISDCSYSHKWGIWGNLWGVPKITPHLSKPLYIGFSSNLGGISQKRYISKFLKIAFLLSHCDVSLILFTISWWLCVLHHTSSIRHLKMDHQNRPRFPGGVVLPPKGRSERSSNLVLAPAVPHDAISVLQVPPH